MIKVTECMIQELINNKPPNVELAYFIADELNKAEMTRAEVEKIDEKLQELVRQHRLAVDIILAEMKGIQNKCNHYFAQFYLDPSDCNDSWTQCLVCNRRFYTTEVRASD